MAFLGLVRVVVAPKIKVPGGSRALTLTVGAAVKDTVTQGLVVRFNEAETRAEGIAKRVTDAGDDREQCQGVADHLGALSLELQAVQTVAASKRAELTSHLGGATRYADSIGALDDICARAAARALWVEDFAESVRADAPDDAAASDPIGSLFDALEAVVTRAAAVMVQLNKPPVIKQIAIGLSSSDDAQLAQGKALMGRVTAVYQELERTLDAAKVEADKHALIPEARALLARAQVTIDAVGHLEVAIRNRATAPKKPETASAKVAGAVSDGAGLAVDKSADLASAAYGASMAAYLVAKGVEGGAGVVSRVADFVGDAATATSAAKTAERTNAVATSASGLGVGFGTGGVAIVGDIVAAKGGVEKIHKWRKGRADPKVSAHLAKEARSGAADITVAAADTAYQGANIALLAQGASAAATTVTAVPVLGAVASVFTGARAGYRALHAKRKVGNLRTVHETLRTPQVRAISAYAIVKLNKRVKLNAITAAASATVAAGSIVSATAVGVVVGAPVAAVGSVGLGGLSLYKMGRKMKKVIKEEKMRADWARELVDYALAGSGRVQEEARILLTALGVPEGETARSGMEALAAKKMGSW